MTADVALDVREDAIVRARPCRFCRVPAGDRCMSRGDGRRLNYNHDERLRDAGMLPPRVAPIVGSTPGEDWTARLLAGVTTDGPAREIAERAQRVAGLW